MSLFDTGIRPAVDSWLLRESRKTRDYGNFWSASSAGYCQRKVIFERLGVPHVEKENDARKQRVFTAGHLFHDWIQGITKESGLSIAQELELQDEDLMIRGHIDDLVLVESVRIHDLNEDLVYKHTDRGLEVDHPKTLEKGIENSTQQHLILYDYKTQNSRAFSYKRDEMSHYHKMQLGTYMYMLRKWFSPENTFLKERTGLEGKDITEGRILKISKDDLRMKEQQLLWDTQLESDVVSYWTKLNDHWKKKTIPKCTCGDQENGFMAKEKWNPYFYEGHPCSIEWYKLKKKEGLLNGANNNK